MSEETALLPMLGTQIAGSTITNIRLTMEDFKRRWELRNGSGPSTQDQSEPYAPKEVMEMAALLNALRGRTPPRATEHKEAEKQ